MTGPVDVLAVMARVSTVLDTDGDEYGFCDKLDAARAAVAELIEADKECDAASEAWESAPGNVQAIGDTDGRDCDGPEYRRLVIAIERRRIALANVGHAS